MKKILFSIATILLLFLVACSPEENIQIVVEDSGIVTEHNDETNETTTTIEETIRFKNQEELDQYVTEKAEQAVEDVLRQKQEELAKQEAEFDRSSRISEPRQTEVVEYTRPPQPLCQTNPRDYVCVHYMNGTEESILESDIERLKDPCPEGYVCQYNSYVELLFYYREPSEFAKESCDRGQRINLDCPRRYQGMATPVECEMTCE